MVDIVEQLIVEQLSQLLQSKQSRTATAVLDKQLRQLFYKSVEQLSQLFRTKTVPNRNGGVG